MNEKKCGHQLEQLCFESKDGICMTDTWIVSSVIESDEDNVLRIINYLKLALVLLYFRFSVDISVEQWVQVAVDGRILHF